jgi:hypothetical protein
MYSTKTKDKIRRLSVKRIIFLFFTILFLVTFCLTGGARVKITGKTGHWLTIAKGSRSGVKVNMRGKVLRMFMDRGKKIPFTLGIFVVKKTTANSAELYIEKAAKNVNIDSAEIVEFYDTLESKPAPAEQFKGLKTRGLAYLMQKQFEKAGKLLKQAGKLKPGDKEIEMILEGLDLLGSPEISISDYIVFKATYPRSPLLNDLGEKLRKLEPHLPLDHYLTDSYPVSKNSKGYYKISFENGHRMIYIPQLKLFIDKYEVANSLFIPFAEANEIIPEIIKFSEKEHYPYCCEEHPAIVSYKEAVEYCEAKRMRLPTEEEWEIIAGRDSGLNYGWGNSIVAGGEYCTNFESLDDGYVEIAPVKSFERFLSTFGAVNMIGNVYEWVQGQFCKGGGFLSEAEELAITHRSQDENYVGFRCVMEAGK